MKKVRRCTFSDCDRKHFAKGVCKHHFDQLPETKQYRKEYLQRPEVKQRLKEYERRPEVKERKQKYRQRPEVKERLKKMRQLPEYKERMRLYQQKYNRLPKPIQYYKERSAKTAERDGLKKRITHLLKLRETAKEKNETFSPMLQTRLDCYTRLYEMHFIEKKEGLPACIINKIEENQKKDDA